MAIKVILLYILYLIYAGVDCQLTVKPDSKEVCVGSDVTLNWTYSDANNFALVLWKYIDSTPAETTIMQHVNGETASVIGGYNVQHDGNGAMTLTNVALSNTGTYKIAVSYSSATPADEHSVSVTVNDPPAGLSASNTTSGARITYTCIATSAGDPDANLYIQVNGVDKTSAVSAVVGETDTVKCCVSGPSVQCMSGVTSTVFCQCIQCVSGSTTTSSPAIYPCDRTCINMIVIIIVAVVILFACVLVCYCLRRRKNIKKKKDSSKVINSNQPYDNDILMTSDTRGNEENNRL